MKPGTRLQMSTCLSSWSASACSSTQEKTRGRSCGSSRCLPPPAAARSPTSMTACRRCGCGSSLRCTLWLGSLNSSSSSRLTVCSSPWNEKQRFQPLLMSSSLPDGGGLGLLSESEMVRAVRSGHSWMDD